LSFHDSEKVIYAYITRLLQFIAVDQGKEIGPCHPYLSIAPMAPGQF